MTTTPARSSRRLSAEPLPGGGLMWLAMGTVYLVWGSTYLAIRVTVETMPGLLAAGVRFLVAGALLAAAVAARRGRRALGCSARQVASAWLVGLLLLLGGNGAVMLGERTVPSGLAALLIAAVPLWVVVMRVLLGDRPTMATVLGVLVGFAGLAVLVLPGRASGHALGGATLGGVLTIGVAALCWSIGSVASGRLPLPADPFVTTVWELLGGGAGCLVAGAASGELPEVDLGAVSAQSWCALGYLVTFGSLIAFTAYAWLLQNAPISLVATYAYVNPVVAVALGALILGEDVTATIAIGGAIVVAGVVLVVTTERRRPAVLPPEGPPAKEEAATA